jgi:post-segregation antitoxin (ccd killing protein)
MKAHTGFEGNEVADNLAKEAAQDADDRNIVYTRITITSMATELKKEKIIKWQRQWESTEKRALCRSFFPTVEQRLKIKLSITREFTAIVKLIDHPMCPCNERI